ncbi:cadherin repeat domain-containing protein, partial [Psychromonas algicola]|uniref:cadherin repeat domain-containing protein n=1 Tax=Psychromonas algicola TaxID=2555642 RepID=UPI001067D34D
NSGGYQVVYTVTATDENNISYSLSGADANAFAIDSMTGEVILTSNPDYEEQESYSFNVVATDEAGNASEQTVTLNINDVAVEDETAPTNTFTGATYDETSNTLTLTGTDMNTLLSGGETDSTDIKNNFNWDNLQWDISSDDTDNVTFSFSDIESVYVTDDNTLAITLTTIKANELEGTNRFDDLTEDDSIEITTGFSEDSSGNASTTDAYVGEALMNTSIVVFDLINGESSAHSDRTFDPDVSYTIYIRVDSDDQQVINFNDASEWSGGDNLGSDDLIVLVGDDSVGVLGGNGDLVTRIRYSGPGGGSGSAPSTAPSEYTQRGYLSYRFSSGMAIDESGSVRRRHRTGFERDDLWSGEGESLFDPQITTLSDIYLVTMPSGILTSQGLV